MPNIDDFKAKLTGGGSRANLFRVTCNFPAGIETGGVNELASFFIKGAGLPASVQGVIELPYRGRKLKIAGDRTFDPWTITVLNDVNFTIRNAFESWMNSINQHIDNVGTDNANEYQTDMVVEQLNRADEVLKTYEFKGVFPTNISQIDLNFDNVDQIEEFTVELQYQYWTSNTTS
jgi:hypothetical protein